MAQSKTGKGTVPVAQSKTESPPCTQGCPVVGVLIEYYQGQFGNDARPQILQDLRDIQAGKNIVRPEPETETKE